MALPRIFVSHSNQDNTWCATFVEALEGVGFDAWYDKKGLYVGSQWVKAIETALQQRDVFLVILSPDAWASEWVQEELALALGQRKRIIGVIHRKTALSGFITNRQLLDVIGQSAERAASQVAAALGAVQQSSSQTPSTKSPLPSSTPRPANAFRPTVEDVLGVWESQKPEWFIQLVIKKIYSGGLRADWKSGPSSGKGWSSSPTYEGYGAASVDRGFLSVTIEQTMPDVEPDHPIRTTHFTFTEPERMVDDRDPTAATFKRAAK